MRLVSFLIALIWASAASAADWWWIGLNGDAPHRVVTYVDRETETRQNGAILVWTLAVGETPLPSGQQHQATQYRLRCRQRSLATMSQVPLGPEGNAIEAAKIMPGRFAPVVAGSIGESILRLVCGQPSGMEVRVASPLAHARAWLSGEAPSAQADPAPAPEERGLSVGTGFFIGGAGDILTSFHVIEGADRFACRTPDGAIHEATVARVSPANDLALLRVNLRPRQYLSFAPPGSLRPGDRVFTFGYGAPNFLGIHEPRFAEGSVSALSGLGAENAYMQISVPVHPGNSGGPVVNEAGQVVGIVAAQAAADAFLRVEGTLPQNINWAVKAEYAAPLLAPLPVAPRRTREQAIELVRNAVCLVLTQTGEG